MALALLSLVLCVIVAAFFYLTRNFNYWEKHGIPSVSFTNLLINYVYPTIFMKKNMGELYAYFYDAYKGHSMVGFYNFTRPALVVREPELVKTVLQTNFTSFHENTMKIDPELDPLLSTNPFFTYGDTWATSRKRLTYAFSSMRLKILAETVKGVSKKLDDYMERKLAKCSKVEHELKDLFSRFTAEVVANAGFGVEGFAFEDNPQSTSFLKMGQKVFQPSFSTGVAQLMIIFLPVLNKIFKLRFLPKEVDRFFRKIVHNVLQARRQESIPRKDFFQLMMDLEKTEGQELDESVLASHALSFFADGYETSSATLTFIGYDIARHPEIQQKLREEVLAVLSKHDGSIDYESIKEMKYMDQVISESQRHFPIVGAMIKVCTEAFELKGTDGLTCRVEPGTEIVISTKGLHKDPKFWTNPDVFDPERFNDERKQEIQKFTFIPFGEGPRICVGMRMAILQMKACLATLLRKYTFELSPKTQSPLEMHPAHFLMLPRYGAWVYLKKIQ